MDEFGAWKKAALESLTAIRSNLIFAFVQDRNACAANVYRNLFGFGCFPSEY